MVKRVLVTLVALAVYAVLLWALVMLLGTGGADCTTQFSPC